MNKYVALKSLIEACLAKKKSISLTGKSISDINEKHLK